MTLIVHHLRVSQSERIVWLCEELGLNYDLRTYWRVPVLAPPEYKALHFSGTAPVIQDVSGAQENAGLPPLSDRIMTLAETGACAEYICHRHGGGRLFLKPDHPDYVEFLYWWHWSNGSFTPSLVQLIATAIPARNTPPDDPAASSAGKTNMQIMSLSRLRASLAALDERLGTMIGTAPQTSSCEMWLEGREFTVADIMVVFSLTTMRYYTPVNLGGYDNILAYLRRVYERPGYRRAMQKCEPGMDLENILGANPPVGPPPSSSASSSSS